jgi:hypothetical protein
MSKKLRDIQISATPNAQQSSVKIDGVTMRGIRKLTLIVECDRPTKLILEGIYTDEQGHPQVELVDGVSYLKTFERTFFGGSIRIIGAAPE